MKYLDLSISSLPVQIKILTVDGQPFTKILFNQLQHKYPYKYPYRTEDNPDDMVLQEDGSVIGFVYLDGFRWLIIEKDGGLYKAKCTYSINYFLSSPSELVQSEDDCTKNHKLVHDYAMNVKDSMQLFILI